jgi:hypothetical protein
MAIHTRFSGTSLTFARDISRGVESRVAVLMWWAIRVGWVIVIVEDIVQTSSLGRRRPRLSMRHGRFRME